MPTAPKRRHIAWISCVVIFVLLVTGCNQPSPSFQEGAVDSSVPGAYVDQNESSNPEASASETTSNSASAEAQSEAPAPSQDGALQSAQASEVPASSSAAEQVPASPEPSAVVNNQDKVSSAGPSETAGGQKPSAVPSSTPTNQAKAPLGSTPSKPSSASNPSASQAPKSAASASTASSAPAIGSTPAYSAAPSPSQDVVPTAKPEATEPPKRTTTRKGGVETLKFSEMYAGETVRGIQLSDKLVDLNNQKVEMTGFMAPPLSASVRFFVLTRVAMSICPFCSTDADWPSDIVVVFLPEGSTMTPTDHQVKVTGTLSVGSQTDSETGFVSLVRIAADKVEVLK